MANASTKQDKDVAKAELEKLRKEKSDTEKVAEDKGFKEAKESYIKQVDATKDIFFQSSWKATREKLGCGPITEMFTTPPLNFLSDYMTSYAEEVFKVL
ncbi:hypothetical protein CsSME_00010843 [Camellia sinensis var. sinensis]